MSFNWRERLPAHDYVIEGTLAHPYESIQLGNGDIGVSANILPHELKLTLAKSDIWDARFDGRPEQDVLTHDALIRMMREKNRDLKNAWDTGSQATADYYVDRLVENSLPHLDGPAPKRAGCVRLYHPGLSNTKVTTRVRLEDGTLETRYAFKRGALIVTAFAQMEVSRLWLRVRAEGETPWFVLIVEKEPDQANDTIPMPVLTHIENHLYTIEQTIPEGFGIDAFTWCMAAAFPESAEGVDAAYVEKHVYRLRQYCSLEDGKTAELCVGIATDRDGEGDTRARALALSDADGGFDAALAAQRASWARFWDASHIALGDTELESVWYRNHFAYGCALSRRSKPLGSGGNVMVQDFEPWHGDIHTNHNFQKWYSTALPTNHAEWIDVYADFINDTLPLFEYQSKLIFGLEGAYCDLSYLPIMSHKHFNINNHMGRALAITGWMGLLLWHHWEFMRDKAWLRERGYPYIKRAAEFYANYMDKYGDASGQIYPSIRIEEPGWMKDFKGNRNVISDLCMFRNAFDIAIAAAEVLDVDADWRERWAKARARVPAIEHGFDEKGEGWIALDSDWSSVDPMRRTDEARWSRWGGGGWVVYPGEYVDGDGDDSLTNALRDMIRRTDLTNPFYSKEHGRRMYPGVPIVHPISSIVPAIRLGVGEHFDSVKKVLLSHRLTYGQFSSYTLADGDIPPEVMGYSGYAWYDWRSVENKYIGVLAVTEMLLQSQGGIIRLFPFWPREKDAAFTNLRAAGGFIVSATLQSGAISATLTAVADGMARIKCPSANPIVTHDGKPIPFERNGNIIEFNVQKGMSYNCDYAYDPAT